MKRNYKSSLLPTLELKRKWMGPIEVIPKDSKVIIKVPRKRDLNRTALDVIEKYAERLMFCSKHHINEKIRRSLEYFLMRDMIMKLDNEMYPESHSLLNRFYDEIAIATLKNDDSLEHVYDVEEIANKGLMDALLTIYLEIENRIQSKMPRDYVLNETLEVFNFVLSIATKKPRENIDLVFKGRIVNVGVILVNAESEFSFLYYLRRIQEYVTKDIKFIFILGAGLVNCEVAKTVAEVFVKENYSKWKMMMPVENDILSLSTKTRTIRSTCILIKKR